MSELNRRNFLKTSVAAGAAIALTNKGKSQDIPFFTGPIYDLVAVMGGEPTKMYDLAIASMGGLNLFIKKGDTVVVKPNIGWDTTPERAGCTNPELVGRIVKNCYEAGAKEVRVFDYTCNEWEKCYQNSGIEKAVKNAGGKLFQANNEKFYREVTIPMGKKLKKEKVHELILESDKYINVPVLKHHGSAVLTIAMKNHMGIIWDRRYWHRNDLHQCIADFASYFKPTLNVVDAYRVMKRNGPRGVSVDDVVLMKSLIVSTDQVAADAASAKLFGIEPEEVPHIKIAHDMGLGTMDLDKLRINRIKI
jgi:uncharacterized protein (DUF362 family)